MQKNSIDEPLQSVRPPEKVTERLESWKDIAAYLNRDVTTVQRWEKREGMPVHRHLHDKRGSVYALTSELDVWRQTRKLRLEEGEAKAVATEEVAQAVQSGPPVSRMRRWFFLGSGVAALTLLMLLYVTRNRAGVAQSPKIKSVAVLPLQKLERGSISGLFRRRHDRGAHRPALDDSWTAGHFSHFEHALQEHAAVSARNCQDARGGRHH